MKQQKQSYDSPREYKQEYTKFRGVDFSADPALIDESRSPWAVNLISDTGGNPEKRPGWRILWKIEAPVNGLFRTMLKGKEYLLAHGGSKLYLLSGNTPKVLREGISNSRSTAFTMAEKLWILTGGEYLAFDGTSIRPVSEIAYIPLVVIGRKPAGGGTLYEDINLLGDKQKNSFLADGSSKTYQLTATNIQGVEGITVNGSAVTAYTVNLAAGTVTFTTAPAAPAVAGQDNVVITFRKAYEGYSSRIATCRTAALFSDRVFVTGNPDFPNRDWYSALNNPAYIPDLSYSQVGSEETAIVGYRRLGQYLAIVKEDNSQDSTLFLRSATVSDIGVVFAIQPGAVGIGAISRYAFANLMDEPLFLSRTGVYAITSNVVTAERTIKNRSYFVDARLAKEEGLEEAVACEWNGYYLLAVNERCYILDGKQAKSYKGQYAGDYSYECYYWENVPARVLLENRGVLYFGAASGEVCRMNDDLPGIKKYNDNGQAITACWSTKADDDGDFMRYKTMVKRGCGVMIKPYTRSGVHVLLRSDSEAVEKEFLYETTDIWDWEDIDFNRISFNANDAPRVIPFNKKKKKYLTLQIIVKNDSLNEGFGVFGIIKRYTVGSYYK